MKSFIMKYVCALITDKVIYVSVNLIDRKQLQILNVRNPCRKKAHFDKLRDVDDQSISGDVDGTSGTGPFDPIILYR